jgi:hypothetical protein
LNAAVAHWLDGLWRNRWQEALEGLAAGDRHASARADRASSGKSFRCTGELIRTG